MPLTPDQKEIRRLRSYLKDLTTTVSATLASMDQAMKVPSTFTRGRHIARLMNTLNMQNDAARHFGLGEPLTRKESDERRNPADKST